MTVDRGEYRLAANVLNDLIVMNRGIVNVYQTAADQLDEERNRELVLRASETHERLAIELSSLVGIYGGKSVSIMGPPSAIKQAWLGVKGTLMDGDGPILTEVAAEAEKILAAYAEAMGADLPEDARNLLRKHLSQARLWNEKLMALSAVYNQ